MLNILLIIVVTLVIAGVTYTVFKASKEKDIIKYLVEKLNKNEDIINKVKLLLLTETVRNFILSKINNNFLKMIFNLFWKEISVETLAKKIETTGKKQLTSVADVVISKTVDKALKEANYNVDVKDFVNNTNLKITEEDRGYVEAYIEGQINKLEEAKIGLKAGAKW